MILGVGFEVVDIDGGKARDEELQLLLGKDGDEPLGNDIVKAVEERVDLLANRA